MLSQRTLQEDTFISKLFLVLLTRLRAFPGRCIGIALAQGASQDDLLSLLKHSINQ